MEKAGFRLDARNALIDFLVIDSISKTPTEN
jgi:uncharacterized protein (TIGR03435 family)